MLLYVALLSEMNVRNRYVLHTNKPATTTNLLHKHTQKKKVTHGRDARRRSLLYASHHPLLPNPPRASIRCYGCPERARLYRG